MSQRAKPARSVVLSRLSAVAMFVAFAWVAGCSGSDSSVDSNAKACTDATLPTPTTACKVAGTYQIQATPRCPNTCNQGTTAIGPLEITTDGVKATGQLKTQRADGTLSIFVIDCKLNGCDCTGTSHLVFTADGFVGEGQATVGGEAGSCSYSDHYTATRQ